MPKLVITCVILVQLIHVLHGQTPVLITGPSDTEVRAGEEATLQCVFNGDATNCYWSRNDGEVGINGGRYTYVSPTLATGDCSFTIANSNYDSDNGFWHCGIKQTSESQGIKSNVIRYSVLIPPDDPILELNDVQVANGSDIELYESTDFSQTKLECVSQGGNPESKLMWRLQDVGDLGEGSITVTSNDNKTFIVTSQLTETPDVTWQNKELYCVVTHGSYDGERIVQGIVKVPHVTQSVVLSTGTGFDSLDVNSGDYVTLTCTPDGHPAPAIKYESRQSDNDDWNEFSPQVSGYNFTFKAYDGQFMCEASNDNWANSMLSNVITIKTNSASSAGMSAGAIAGIVIAVLIVVGIAVGILVCYKKEAGPFKHNEHNPVPTTEPNFPPYKTEKQQNVHRTDDDDMHKVELGENENH